MYKYKLILTDEYKKREKQFLKKHKNLADLYLKTLGLTIVNPFHPSLRIHKLKGNLHEYYSISLNMQYRIIIDFIIKDGDIIPLDIGDHNIYR